MSLWTRAFLVWCAVVSLTIPSQSVACSAFQLTGNQTVLFGKSYDWHAGHGMMMVNKRAVAKRAFVSNKSTNTPAEWISHFGSVTFTQFGQELPLGGINEAGLVIEILWLSGSKFPTESQKPVLNELQWIQYILDTSETISEAMTQARKVDITKIYADVHYLVCDRFADCATFEYLDETLVIHHQPELPTPALTNNTYANSVAFLSQHQGFGGERTIPRGAGSLERFVRTAANLQNFNEERQDGLGYAFNMLHSVRSMASKWQIVYDQTNGAIRVRLPNVLGYTPTQTITTDHLDYSCTTSVLALDIRGDITRPTWQWRPLDYALNLRLLQVGNQSLGGAVGEQELNRLAQYPASLSCLD